MLPSQIHTSVLSWTKLQDIRFHSIFNRIALFIMCSQHGRRRMLENMLEESGVNIALDPNNCTICGCKAWLVFSGPSKCQSRAFYSVAANNPMMLWHVEQKEALVASLWLDVFPLSKRPIERLEYCWKRQHRAIPPHHFPAVMRDCSGRQPAVWAIQCGLGRCRKCLTSTAAT